MSHWPFVVGAYAVTFLGTAGVVVLSWIAMRRAERDAEGLRNKP